ncbi:MULTISPECIES: TonB-dependent receptor [unclassified Azospirillum]|uniref:TonB-dependent receptor n=1 Tax=unclassified Azospirillum TaxID=2630922 RepID=UPI000B6A7A68|nr:MULTISPECIES: TonB-dependent receptor [unclassified Azospirillum]SNR94804.1 iron complex outermembrane recepter protein [Azospirillum sp. RU38E]SNS10978.1 iron complex outermembrane recepter protein [Azospirillum sp. RU37A]
MLKISGLVVSLSALALSQTAYAQESQDAVLEEIVVTAQKREQNLQSVPVSVTALSADAIVTKGITQFENLSQVAPGLTITQGTQRTGNSINLRGIGTSAFSTGVEPAVAVVVDDVPILNQGQAFTTLSDIERIEVLRGPQGTLFGKNASAGVVSIVTRAPSDHFTGRIGASATTDDAYRIEAGLSGPIAEGVGVRVNGFYSDLRGHVKNQATGNYLGADESWGLRGKLVADLSERVTVNLSAEHSQTDANSTPRTARSFQPGSVVFGASLTANSTNLNVGPNNYAVNQNYDGLAKAKATNFSGRAVIDLGDVDLVSVTSYQKWGLDTMDDVDQLNLPVFNSPTGLVQVSPYDTKFFTQELRLISTAPSRFQYILGAFYADGKTDRSFDRGPAGPLLAAWTSATSTKTMAAFAQATYDLAEKTHLDGGIRYNHEKIDVDFQRLNRPAVAPANNAICLTTCSGDASDNHVTGKIALRQDLAERMMVYASFATGYKGQGYDVSSGFTPSRAANPVKPETSNAYELGLKSRFLSNRVQLNVTGFWTDYDNYQSQSGVVQPDLSVVLQLNNVGKLRTRGVEVEVQTKPTQALSFDFSATYLDAKVREYPFANCFTGQTAAQGCFDIDGAGPGTATAQDLAGKPLANAPKFMFNTSAAYDIALESLPFDGFVTLDYRYQSKVNFDLTQNPLYVQKAYGIFNGSIGIKGAGDAYRITLFVNNLFDKHYASNVSGLVGGPPTAVGQVLSRNSRRYFGIRANYNF